MIRALKMEHTHLPFTTGVLTDKGYVVHINKEEEKFHTAQGIFPRDQYKPVMIFFETDEVENGKVFLTGQLACDYINKQEIDDQCCHAVWHPWGEIWIGNYKTAGLPRYVKHDKKNGRVILEIL